MTDQNPEAAPTDPADVHDRAMPDGGTAMSAPSHAQTQPRWDANSQSQPSVLPVAAGAGVFVALVAWVIWRLKARHAAPPTPSERLGEATKTLGAASARFGDRASGRLGDVAGYVSAKAPDVASRTADVAGDVAGYVSDKAPQVASQAASAASDLGSKAGNVAADVGEKAVDAAMRAGEGIGDAAGAVAEGAEHVYDRTTTWLNRLFLALIAFLGYVLGARAGRERYEQIAGLARGIAERPEVQQAQHKVQQKVQEQTGMGSAATPGP